VRDNGSDIAYVAIERREEGWRKERSSRAIQMSLEVVC